MNVLSRGLVFTLLTVAAVLSFVAAAWLSAGAGWPARLSLGALTLALWAVWFGAYRVRLRGGATPGEPVSPPDAARNRFMIVHAALALLFVIAMLFGAGVISTDSSLAARMAATAAPAAVLTVWAWEFARMVIHADEMMRAIHLRAIAVAAGVVLFGVSLWHLFAVMLGLPEFSQTFLLPAFAVIYSLAMGAQRQGP
jgi:hypothetical protein